MRGGGYLAGREVVGLGLRFGGVLLVTRLIGPSNFGIYAGVLALVTLFASMAQLGAEVYLVRYEREPDAQVYDQVFTVLLFSTVASVVIGLAGSYIVQLFVGENDFVEPFQVLLLALPLGVLWAPAQAKLERAFRFRRMATLQLSSDLMLYVVAVPLAFAGLGFWAPIAGTFASYGWLLIFSFVLADYRPRVNFSRARVMDLGRYGGTFVPAGMLARVEYLVNPLVVGPILGPASVGYVALALRLVDTVSFVLRATYRISLVAFSRVQSDPVRLRRGFEEMMSMQILALGPVLVALAVSAPWLVPFLFGNEWQPAVELIPFVSAGALVLCIFNAHIALLYVLGQALVASIIGLVRVVLLFVAALVLVPPFGLVGYGLAVLVTSLGWLVADREVGKLMEFSYGLAFRWAVAFLPPLFLPLVDGPWRFLLLAPTLIVLCDPGARGQLRGYLRFVRGALANRRSMDSGT